MSEDRYKKLRHLDRLDFIAKCLMFGTLLIVGSLAVAALIIEGGWGV